ncbi:PREDICTED: zinc finger BED domain-containing protein 4-like [Rhagoletis zephyria]|uniref:zinc finger BED domain-containing protein 4-like n=1 Tax=Rhagoletis zephyria TaxID=28612 RepID=UPI00081134BB|nr:PREDICTED: zinc finger BED domain-containing protein 4-like [Rhagoletis zephyria]
MIPAQYEKCKHKMQEIIEGGDQFCITTDCWTSRNVSSFIAVTAHFVSQEFELKSILLAASELNINHTAENLANAIQKIVCDWKIESKVLLAVSDNASNIKSAIIAKLNWKHFGCMAHTMNLIVKEGLRLPEVNHIIEKVKAIVSYFKKSSSANEAFLNYQRNSGKEPLKLIQQVETRWNSTLAMMERFAALEEAIKCTLVILNKTIPTLSTEEWQIVNDLCKICQPFKDATISISGETYCTGSLKKRISIQNEPVIGVTEEQPSTSNAIVIKMTQTKISNMHRQSSKQDLNNKLLQLFTVDLQPFSLVEDNGFREFVRSLNPNYELPSSRVISKTMIPAQYEKCKRKMQEIIEGGDQFCITTDCWTSRNVSSFIAVTAHFVSQEFELKPILLAASELNLNHTAENLANAIQKSVCDWKIESKVLLAVSDNASNIKSAIIAKLNWKHFGSGLAKKYLCALASSVPCERIFSKAGQIVSDRRSRLSEKNTEMLLFLNTNEKYLWKVLVD